MGNVTDFRSLGAVTLIVIIASPAGMSLLASLAKVGRHRYTSVNLALRVLNRGSEVRSIRFEYRTDVTDFAAEHVYDLETQDRIVF